MLNLLNCFAASICRYVIQVVINTVMVHSIEIFAQVYISILTRVHNSYLLLTKKINISKSLTSLTEQNRKSEKLH